MKQIVEAIFRKSEENLVETKTNVMNNLKLHYLAHVGRYTRPLHTT